MTVGQIKTLVAGWLDDPNKAYFTDSLLLTWINLAHREAQLKLLQAGQNYYEVPVETVTVSGQGDYVLPSDFVTEHRLEIVTSGTGVNENIKQLMPITTNQQNFYSKATGLPEVYSLKKDRFSLYPTPDAVYTIRLYYSPMVSDLGSDSDVPDVPEQFMEFVALIAGFHGFIKDDRAPNTLLQKKQEFDSLLKQMAADRTQDTARSVVMTTDYDSGVFY